MSEANVVTDTDPSIIIVVITLVIFVLCILILTKACECVFNRQRVVQRRASDTSRTSIYIIEDNGDVLVINPRAGDVEKCEVKHSYENLAPPPYIGVLNTLAEASYELPPSYPIDT